MLLPLRREVAFRLNRLPDDTPPRTLGTRRSARELQPAPGGFKQAAAGLRTTSVLGRDSSPELGQGDRAAASTHPHLVRFEETEEAGRWGPSPKSFAGNGLREIEAGWLSAYVGEHNSRDPLTMPGVLLTTSVAGRRHSWPRRRLG